MASKPGTFDIPGRPAAVSAAGGRGAACVWPRRCPVYRWREVVAGAGMEQENLSSRYRPPVSMGAVRPPGGDRKARCLQLTAPRSTVAGHRGGPARSSDEGRVMRLERRSRAGQVTLRSTLRGRN
jgi:hypothetical protein